MENLSIDLPTFEPGSVWIVGAGPGDPGLLSILALHGIQQADVIVYDALVGDEIITLAGENAEMEYAGQTRRQTIGKAARHQ